MSLRTNNLYS